MPGRLLSRKRLSEKRLPGVDFELRIQREAEEPIQFSGVHSGAGLRIGAEVKWEHFSRRFSESGVKGMNSLAAHLWSSKKVKIEAFAVGEENGAKQHENRQG